MDDIETLREMVTIVVPVYNGERFLRENVECLLNQSYKNLEIIYVCDGCTDQTVNVLQEYAYLDTRLKLQIELENQGAAVSRNIGKDMANGEWIIFLDSDDLFEPDMIEVMLERALNTRADMCCCFWEYFDEKPIQSNFILNENIKLYMETYPVIEVEKEKKYILQQVFNACWNKLIHKTIYKKSILFFQNLPNCDDAYFSSVAVMEAKRISYIDRILVHYRSDRGRYTLSTSQKIKKNYAWEAYDKVYQYICQKDNNQELMQSFYNKICEYIQSFFMNSFGQDISISNSAYRKLFSSLCDVYVEKWRMNRESIQESLNFFNWEVYKKIRDGEYRLDRDTLVMDAKENFVRNMAKRNKCSIWGCGYQGRKLLEMLGIDSLEIQHIFDSDSRKWGTYISGKKIEMFNLDRIDTIIVTSSKYYGEIKEQIGDRAANVYNLEKDIFKVTVR